MPRYVTEKDFKMKNIELKKSNQLQVSFEFKKNVWGKEISILKVENEDICTYSHKVNLPIDCPITQPNVMLSFQYFFPIRITSTS